MTSAALSAPPSPYKGLAAFTDSELDVLFFFGREREIEVIAANLVAARLTVLYGPSGAGKTSLLRAGVAQRLRSEGAAVVAFSMWSGDPIEGVLSAVEEEVHRLAPAAEAPRPGSVADTFALWTRRLGGDLYLILDQFEEYFLYHAEDGGGGPFVELAEVIRRPDAQVHVLLSVREDALAQLDAFKTPLPGLFGNSLRLDRLDRRSATRAILGPLERYNELVPATESVEAEDELVAELLDSVETGRIQLGDVGRGGADGGGAEVGRIEAPYLQLVLERLWEVERAHGSRRLRLETLRELGGAARVVEDHLERAMAVLAPAEKDAAAAMYNHLVTPSGTKIAHRAGDLARYAEVDEREAQLVLERLARERIVRAGENGAVGPQYEIFHDVLAHAVLAWRTRHESDRRLDEERRQAARRQRRLLAIAGASLVAVALLAGVAAYALSQRGTARGNAREAEAHDLAALAVATLATSPERSLALALEASAKARTPTVENTLRSALRSLRTTALLRAGHSVTDLAYSPDGRLLAAVAAGEVRLYQTTVPYRVRRLKHHQASRVAFSANGRRVLTTGGDRWTRIWNAISGEPLFRVRSPRGVARDGLSDRALLLATTSDDGRARVSGSRAVRLAGSLSDATTGADFNRGGSLLVTTSNTPVARVFDAGTGQIVARLRHRGGIVLARFAPVANIVATAGADKVARLWDAPTGRLRKELKGHVRGLLWVAFSRDGNLVATASTDSTARVWRVADGALVAVLPGHTNFVRRLDFSPDSGLIVTGGRDRVARVFDADAATLRATLAGHDEPLTDVAFAPGGHAVATASTDGTVRIWDARPFAEIPVVRRLPGRIADVAFTPAGRIVSTQNGEALSPDGRRAAGVGEDGQLRIRDVPSGRIVATMDDAATTTAAAFSADARLLVTGDRRGTVRVWRTSDGRVELTVHTAGAFPVSAVAASPDGSRILATAGARAQIWRAADGRLEGQLVLRRSALTRPFGSSAGPFSSAAFSPDGRFVITTTSDHDARFWEVATGRQLWMLPQTAKVSDATFSADGRWVAIAGHGYAGVVDAKTGERILLLDGRDRILTSVAFSHTGWRIATGGRSGAVRTYDCQLCGGIDELIGVAEKRLAQLRPKTS